VTGLRIPLSICAALLGSALAHAAEAHACLESASPRVGARVSAAPKLVLLRYSEAIEPALSVVTVSGPPGFAGAGPARQVAGDPTSLVAPLPGAAPPGRYVVRWRVTSADSHVTQGQFQFEIRP
jgi:copper resistance protein C